VPLQTFTVNADKGVEKIAANSAFMFFISGNKIYAMNKHGYTDMYFDLNVTVSPNVKSLVTYRDELVFFTEGAKVSYIDVTDLLFTPYDIYR
jgi:hypothetical protein